MLWVDRLSDGRCVIILHNVVFLSIQQTSLNRVDEATTVEFISDGEFRTNSLCVNHELCGRFFSDEHFMGQALRYASAIPRGKKLKVVPSYGRRGVTGFYARHFSISQCRGRGAYLLPVAAVRVRLIN